MNLDSIIFDLDGTLWDSSEGVVQSWNETLNSFSDIKRRITLEDVQGVMGLLIQDIAKKFFPDLEDKKRLEVVDKCCEDECKYLEKQGGRLYEKLEETLEILTKRYRLFIVSNCECNYIEAFLKAHKLERYFVDFENPGRTGLTKGENIKLIMDRNNLKSSIYVGDTEGDQKAAKFAGIPFVYASYGFGKVKDYDYVIDSFEELLKLV